MSNSNNIPITWDNEQDNNLFKNFSQGGQSFPGLVSTLINEDNHKWQFLKKSSIELAKDFKKALPYTSKNLTLVQETNCPCEIKPEEILVFYESGKHEGYKKDEDQYLFKIKIFTTTRGESIQQAYYECEEPIDDEALFFIENNTGDVSTAKMYAKFGKKVQKELILKLDSNSNFYTSISKIPGVDKNIIKELIKNGVYEAPESIIKIFAIGAYKFLSIIGIPAKVVGWICEKVGQGIIEYLSLSESVWNSHSEDYFLKKENVIKSLTIDVSYLKTVRELLDKDDKKKDFISLLPDFVEKSIGLMLFAIETMIKSYNDFVTEKINKIYDDYGTTVLVADIQYQLSEKVALFAGIWNGIVDFVGGMLLFIGQIAQTQYNVGSDLDKYLERFDSFREKVSSFDWSKLPDIIEGLYQEIKRYFKDNNQNDFNFDKVAYFSGFSIAFIGTMFIPFTAFAKPIAVINDLKKGLFPTELIEKVSQATLKGGDAALAGSKKALDEGLVFIEQITALLSKGAEGVTEFLKDIWKKIAEWFIENKKIFEKITAKIKQAFLEDSKTEEFFRKIEQKFNLAGDEILSISDLKKLRKLLFKDFKIPLEILDNNPLLKAKLKDWISRRVAGSFNPIEGVMYLRKNVTAYTVQHEMFHMKLWYKMTKEFPELAEAYTKTIGNKLFHEEYVMAEFMKNPNKWKESDLLNDLAEINRLRFEEGLDEVSLEFFKNWNVEESLSKL